LEKSRLEKNFVYMYGKLEGCPGIVDEFHTFEI